MIISNHYDKFITDRNVMRKRPLASHFEATSLRPSMENERCYKEHVNYTKFRPRPWEHSSGDPPFLVPNVWQFQTNGAVKVQGPQESGNAERVDLKPDFIKNVLSIVKDYFQKAKTNLPKMASPPKKGSQSSSKSAASATTKSPASASSKSVPRPDASDSLSKQESVRGPYAIGTQTTSRRWDSQTGSAASVITGRQATRGVQAGSSMVEESSGSSIFGAITGAISGLWKGFQEMGQVLPYPPFPPCLPVCKDEDAKSKDDDAKSKDEDAKSKEEDTKSNATTEKRSTEFIATKAWSPPGPGSSRANASVKSSSTSKKTTPSVD